MDRVLVIYDLTGRVWNIVYGATEVPQGMPSIWVDMPENAVLERVDPVTKQPEFSYLPETSLGQLQRTVADLQLHVAEKEQQTESDIIGLQEDAEIAGSDITDLQIALAEVYEALLGMF